MHKSLKTSKHIKQIAKCCNFQTYALMQESGNMQDNDNIDLLLKSLSLIGNVFFGYALNELKVNLNVH